MNRYERHVADLTEDLSGRDGLTWSVDGNDPENENVTLTVGDGTYTAVIPIALSYFDGDFDNAVTLLAASAREMMDA